MNVIEKHHIKKGSRYYKEVDSLAYLSKNLYNAVLYICRQSFFEKNRVPSLKELYHLIKNSKDYKALPAKVSQGVLIQIDRVFKSYFASIEEYQIHPNKFKAPPKLPRYKDKLEGRNVLVYNYQAISKKWLDKGKVKLSKTNIFIKTKLKNILEARLVPKVYGYVLELVYEKEERTRLISSDSAYIDLGLNNLATLTSNKEGFTPRLICGRALKSCNHYYNKRISKLKSLLPKDKKTSKRIKALTNKRNNKVDYYLHTSTKYIINTLVENNIGLLVIGNNKNWKQNINIGKRNNQNFVSVPHSKLTTQLTYKAQLAGIKVVITEESYTSKCSFLDLEPIKKHTSYLGKRIKRGLFQSNKGYLYSADVNGSLNIGRKVVGESGFNRDSIVRFVVNPIRFKPYKANLVDICLHN